MIRMMRCVAIALAALIATNAAAGRDGVQADAPAAFLRTIYAGYLRGEDPDWLGGREAQAFAPELAALIRRDRLDHPGEVGAIEADPICRCQDFDRLRGLTVTITRRSGSTARARVTFVNGLAPATREVVDYRLLKVGGAWRIADIAGPGEPSLVDRLHRSIDEGRGR